MASSSPTTKRPRSRSTSPATTSVSLRGEQIGRADHIEGAVEGYVWDVVKRIPLDLIGLRIAVDCANGAMFEAAPLALSESGADVVLLATEPDGLNINHDCGSTHLEALQRVVRADGFDLGLAFDGDGDRVLAVDARGALVDGDFVIAILARHLKSKGLLRRDTVVTTVMTNLGFHHAMRREGIEVVTTAVGDRYVIAEMLKHDYVLGGEQSGHIINRDVSTTGDGLATALLLLQALNEMGLPLHEAATVMERLPQRLVNVRVRDRDGLEGATAVWQAVDARERATRQRRAASWCGRRAPSRSCASWPRRRRRTTATPSATASWRS